MRAFLATLFLCLLFCVPAQAKTYSKQPTYQPLFGFFNEQPQKVRKVRKHKRHMHRKIRKHRVRLAKPSANGLEKTYIRAADVPAIAVKTIAGYAEHLKASVQTGCLPQPLKAILSKVQASCPGFVVVSAFRRNAKVAGTNRTSLHASCKAADIQVRNYPCAYAVLKGFPGGVSMDATRVRHIHVSYDPRGREWGSRFNHGGRSYARRVKHRYARRGHRA